MERKNPLCRLVCYLCALALVVVPVQAASGATPAKGKVDGLPGDVYLKQITLDEAAQFISQIGKASIVVSSSVANKVVSLYLRDVSVEGMVKNLCRAAGVWYRVDAQTGAYILMNAQEYQQDIAIARDEITRNYVLRHHNVVSIANAIEALFGNRVELVEPVEEMPPEDLSGMSGGYSGGYGNNNNNGNGYGNNNYGNNNRGYGNNNRSGRNTGYSPSNRVVGSEGTISRRRGGTSNTKQVDARKEMSAISQAGLEAALDIDSSQETTIGAADVLAATTRQGLPISVTYNKLHNLLLVRTSDEAALKDIDKLVADMDRPPRQVLLEMRILEVELGGDFRSIFDIGLSGSGSSRGPQNLGTDSLNGGIMENGEMRYPRQGISLGNFASEAATAVWQLVNDHLRLRLQLLESENRVNVLATPMLVAANNQQARLFIGDEQIMITGASSESHVGTTGATSTTVTVETERRDVGQTLVILPRINADRSVTLTIDQDNSRINQGGSNLPLPVAGGGVLPYPIDTVNTANLQVTAHARDGLTVAVGGMISQRVTDVDEKVPGLGDIPVLGHLFKKTVRSNVRKQLVLLITPHILETPEESDALAQDKAAGLRQLDAAGFERSHATQGKRTPSDSIFDPKTGFAASVPGAEAIPVEAAPAASADVEVDRFGAIARAAADAMRQSPDALPPGGLESVLLPLSVRQPRWLDGNLELQPLRAWKKDGLYVTALRVINLGGQPATFTPTQLGGHWAAIVAEQQQLAPAGGENSWTWIYAISRQPYEEAVERRP